MGKHDPVWRRNKKETPWPHISYSQAPQLEVEADAVPGGRTADAGAKMSAARCVTKSGYAYLARKM